MAFFQEVVLVGKRKRQRKIENVNMSLLCRINSFSKTLNKYFIKNCPGFLYYSRRSDSKDSGSPYKIVKSKINLDGK